jgi:hypothetical protein
MLDSSRREFNTGVDIVEWSKYSHHRTFGRNSACLGLGLRLNFSSDLSICRTQCFYLDKIKELIMSKFPELHANHTTTREKYQFRSMKCQFGQPIETTIRYFEIQRSVDDVSRRR